MIVTLLFSFLCDRFSISFLFFLVHPYIIDFKFFRKNSMLKTAAPAASERIVQEHIVGLFERIEVRGIFIFKLTHRLIQQH